jgi:hypothetical protein
MSRSRSLTEPDNVGETWHNRLARGDKQLHIHLIGIGGAGLSAIATVLLEMGIAVSGSDRQANANTDHLARGRGDDLFRAGRRQLVAENRLQPDVVLISSAIDVENRNDKRLNRWACLWSNAASSCPRCWLNVSYWLLQARTARVQRRQ